MNYRSYFTELKTLFFIALFFLSTNVFSQDNTLPTTGRIGIGTLTPSQKLDINGNAVIDSCLLIKDSLRVNKTIRTMGKMFVEQKMTMKGNAVVNQNMRVNGNSRVDGNLRTFGNSRVDGLLKLPNMGNLSTTNIATGNFDVILLNANGTAKKVDYLDLLAKVKSDVYDPTSGCGITGDNPDGTVAYQSPTWKSAPNSSSFGYLYTGVNCPAHVGIGTSTPLYQLDVRGKASFTFGIKVGTIYTPTTPSLIDGYQNLGVSTPFIHMAVNDLGTNKTVFLVNNDGGIYCTSARVRLKENIPVPDFVFNKNYQLMPLNEVKEYITENSHLPNIPSEKEIKADGLSLDEMQMKLLQKVEELTLYVIELDEKNKKLEAQVKALTK